MYLIIVIEMRTKAKPINILLLNQEITRGMKSLGSKALLNIKNKFKLIDLQMQQISKIYRNNTDITVAVGFEAEKVAGYLIGKKYKCNILYNNDYSENNTGSVVSRYLSKNPDIDNLFIVCNGVLFKPKTILKTHLQNSSKIFTIDKTKKNFNIGCTINDNKTEHLFYDLPNTWTECSFLNQEAITILKSVINKKNISQYYVFEILNELIEKVTFENITYPRKNFCKLNNIKDISTVKLFI